MGLNRLGVSCRSGEILAMSARLSSGCGLGTLGYDSGVTTGLASPSFPYFAVEPLVFLRHVEVPEGIPLAIEVGGS